MQSTVTRRLILKKYRASVLMFLLFEGVAVTLWRTKSNLFYLFNFSYIGSCLSVGLALFTAGKRYARQFVQLAVGLYMLVYLGLMSQENMQIEGFWYYLFSGVFEAATIHYAVAKIFGPLLFGRGWCGYACWTAMVLDLLPFKVPQKSRKEKLGTLRYVMFALSFALIWNRSCSGCSSSATFFTMPAASRSRLFLRITARSANIFVRSRSS